jgi:hypothetical protein
MALVRSASRVDVRSPNAAQPARVSLPWLAPALLALGGAAVGLYSRELVAAAVGCLLVGGLAAKGLLDTNPDVFDPSAATHGLVSAHGGGNS